jgi:ABC-2 type transport system ATP-binding protein
MNDFDSQSPTPPVVELRHVTKVFRDFWRRPKVVAVSDLSIEVRRGEVFGLLGPNGSGKSTTIKTILGLLHASAGEVRVFGRPAGHTGTLARVGYLPEESYLYRYLTARETLDFYARLFGLDAALRRRRTEELLRLVGLQQAANRPVGEFSKGMSRRIGLAQALINDPDLVILDEPTAGLDPVGCRQVKDLIRDLAAQGKTVILSSHLLADVEHVCSRIAILFNGTLRAEGGVRELLVNRDLVRFTVPCADPALAGRMAAWLREQCGSEPAVDNPSMNLESFFLDVVQRAGEGTTGAPARGASRP